MSLSLRRVETLFTAAALTALVGCGSNSGRRMPVVTEDAGTDSGSGETDSGTESDAANTCEIPDTGFGASIGTKLRPFTLEQCLVNESGEGYSEPYSFYENGFCEARFTVLSIAAGWCGPCNVESDEFNEQITQIYGPQGVRLIQVLIQDVSGAPPSIDFCNQWVTQHDLANPELMDPAGVTQIYFPGNSLPSTIIIDSTGTIVYREFGTSESLIGLRHKLDTLLAGS